MMTVETEPEVMNCTAEYHQPITELLAKYGLTLVKIADDAAIPGSFFGDREAGLKGNQLYVRSDTPIHSVLHEAGHYICMDPVRRAALDTNTGGDYDEENAVCYLQILLSDFLPAVGRASMMQDMDSWGYSFRLGSTRAWFEQDAEDARDWLLKHHLITPKLQPSFLRREQ